MSFVRRTARTGRVLVVEPDAASAEEFRRTAERHGLRHVDVVCTAAWSERTTLTMEIDTDHPATSFTAGVTRYSQDELRRFQEVSVAAVPIDQLVGEQGIARVDLISITTNGAEEEILRGSRRVLARDRPYVCLAHTADSHVAMMTDIGYEFVGADDRGFTFGRRK
jgi:FkbM family methyltransferase